MSMELITLPHSEACRRFNACCRIWTGIFEIGGKAYAFVQMNAMSSASIITRSKGIFKRS